MKKILFTYIFIFSVLPAQSTVSKQSVKKVFNAFQTLYKEVQFTEISSNQHNAYATRSDNDSPIINISSALYDNNFVSTDSLSLLICHELGHFYGQSPKKTRGKTKKSSWSSAEGQADFFATSTCLKKVLNIIPEDESIDKRLSPTELEFETQTCTSPNCNRSLRASLEISKMYAEIKFWRYELSYFRKDYNEVYSTLLDHPNPQCRLDTLVAGIQCPKTKTFYLNGKKYLTCEDKNFRQPPCWLKPNLFEDI